MTIYLKISMDASPQKMGSTQITFLLSVHKWISDTKKNKGIHWNFWNKGFQRSYPWLQLKSGFLLVRVDSSKSWMNSPRFLQSIFVHLSSFATLSRLAATSKDNNFSNNKFEQNLLKIIFSPARWFLLSRGYLISTFFLFLYCYWKHMYLFLTLSKPFSLTSQPCPLLFPLLPTLGENRNNVQDCGITWFLSSSPRCPNPSVALRWTLRNSTAKKLKEKKPNNCYFDSNSPFQAASRGLKNPKWSKISFLKALWIHVHILPNSATFVPYSVSNAIEGQTFQ